jgi:hypothetical protein
MNPNTPASSCNTSLICRRDDQVAQAVPSMSMGIFGRGRTEEEKCRWRRLIVRKNMSNEEQRQEVVEILEEALRIVAAPDETELSFLFGSNKHFSQTPAGTRSQE